MAKQKTMNRMFNGLILLFFGTPFLFILYNLVQQGTLNFNLQELLSSDPSINLMFIISFITPFIGYYLLQLKHQLNEKGEGTKISLHLVVTAVSLMIMGNMMYGLLVFILIYFVVRTYKISYTNIFQKIQNKGFAMQTFVGPILLFTLSIIVRVMVTTVNNI